MRIKRDHSRPFFRNQRRGVGGCGLFAGLLIGAILVATISQYNALQSLAFDVIGMAPPPTPFASERAWDGLELYRTGDVEGAAVLLGLAVQQQPDNVDYLYEYGRLLIELNRAEEAVEPGERAINLAPDDPRGYALKARALMWDDPAIAIPIAVNGLEHDSNFAPLHAALAIAYTNIGRYQEALTRGAMAVEIDPLDADAHRSYSIPLIYVGRRLEAIEQLEQAIAINPNLTAPYFELAAQYKALDVNEMAVSIYQRVLELEPDNAKAYLRLCETYSKVGLFPEAQDYCQSALDIDPNYASAYRELGRMQYVRRNYESAIESFNLCVAHGSEEIECWYLRGLAHWILGQCEEGWTVLQESLVRAQEIVDSEPIVNNINTGLSKITEDCPDYLGYALPTAIPPTPVPPTPIGGIGS